VVRSALWAFCGAFCDLGLFAKSYYLCMTNIEIVQNSKSKPKKFSFLCTFNCTLTFYCI
jgi:hypothetical protein